MIDFRIQSEAQKLSDTLDEYVRVSKRTPEEVLEKKGRDLGIQIYRRFSALKWRVSRALRKKGVAVYSGPAFDEAKRRNWRVRVRAGMELEGGYTSLQRTVRDKTRRLNRRAALVAQELATRQRGAGLLGVSFLFMRWRYRRRTVKGLTVSGNYLERNRSGKLGILSTLQKGRSGEGWYMRITNRTPGVAVVDRNRGIIASSLALVRADTAVYLARKQAENANPTLRKIR